MATREQLVKQMMDLVRNIPHRAHCPCRDGSRHCLCDVGDRLLAVQGPLLSLILDVTGSRSGSRPAAGVVSPSSNPPPQEAP